jgi:N-acetylglucosamine-6-phosphate deacetylase
VQKTVRGKDVATGSTLEVTFEKSIASVSPIVGAQELYLAPGWIDVQVNGFSGVDYNSARTSHEEIARSI